MKIKQEAFLDNNAFENLCSQRLKLQEIVNKVLYYSEEKLTPDVSPDFHEEKKKKPRK